MTRHEFSNEFDVLYNNIMSNQAPGLDEYEKSVFLTKAQNEIVKNYFNPKGNKYQEGFDGSQKRQVDFSKLIHIMQSSGNNPSIMFSTVSGVKSVDFPSDALAIINEVVDVVRDGNTHRLQVIPIRYDEYIRLSSKPYKQPLKNQAWRIISSSNKTDLILGHLNQMKEGGYYVRYVKRPNPIILESLGDLNLTIDGRSDPMDPICELDPEIHPEILQRAVELAKAAYVGDLKSSVELGQRSE